MEKCCNSKLRFLSILRKIGAVAAFILMLTALLYLILIMSTTYASLTNYDASLPGIISGRVFSRAFICGFQEETSLQILRWYMLVTILTVIAILCTVTARLFSHRKTRLAYWSFAIPTIALYLYLLLILTLPFSWVIQCINAMGFTLERVNGLLYGLGAYVVILGFLWWAVRKPREKNPQTKIDKIEEQNSALLNQTKVNSTKLSLSTVQYESLVVPLYLQIIK